MRQARRFDCEPESVAAARHFVRDLLSEEPRETVEAAELMSSELATNSVLHARSDFELAILRSREQIRVEVSDHGHGRPVPRSPTPQEQSGRGLQIVQALSEDWGITPSPGGKLVWFTLPLRTHPGEHQSRSTASRDQAPEQSHEPEQSRETDPGFTHFRIAKLRRETWPCKGVNPVLKFKRACATAVTRSCAAASWTSRWPRNWKRRSSACVARASAVSSST
jgi:anti-sigma regulatory factor (Ser/Thr protein kinase)